MHSIDIIETVLMFHGMNYVNLIILDSAEVMHVATYDRTAKHAFVDLNTHEPIDEPVLFCQLPRFNTYLFEGIQEKLYPVKSDR